MFTRPTRCAGWDKNNSGGSTMSAEQNKAIVRRLIQRLGEAGGWLAVHKEGYDPKAVVHFPGMPPLNYEAHEQWGNMLLAAFSDIQVTLEDLIAEGDKVVTRQTLRGTHTGAFQGIPATGKSATVTGIFIFRLAGGKIVEQWAVLDQLGVLRQLGVIPTPGQGGS
jgi:ketosteroid isomerase-like protein